MCDTCYNKNTPYSRVIIESEQMFDDLVACGVVPHKTSILKPPAIDKKYFSSFILGYFDGDGSIYLTNGRSPSYTVSIVGTDEMLMFIHNFFVEQGAISRQVSLHKRKQGQSVSYIRYGGNKLVLKILSLLYKDIDSNIPLKRKYTIYLKCKSKIFN